MTNNDKVGYNTIMNEDEVQSWDIDSLESQADQVLNDEREQVAPSAVISEALERIEQAKLYEVFLRQSIFAAGSARPEIVEKVQEEFRAFALGRLEVLVGLKTDSATTSLPARSPFSEDEVSALKSLAGRMLKKTPEAAVTSPQINTIQANTQPSLYQNQTTHKTPAGLNVTVKPSGPVKKGRKKSGNVSQITGEDLSQAVSTVSKGIPMPSNDAMNAHFATEAARKGSSAGATEIGKLLEVATAHYVKKHQSVKE